MARKKILFSIPLMGVLLCSCQASSVRHDISEYFITPTGVKSLKYDGGFNILHLTDTHIGRVCDRELQYKFIKKTIDLSKEYVKNTQKVNDDKKIDLIVITGDLFTYATKSNIIEYFEFFDSLGIPYTCCFGNHDEQGYYSMTWLTSYLNSLNDNKDSYCIFKDIQNDDVFGDSNFVINVKYGETDNVYKNIYLMDSNKVDFKLEGYDCIHYDQIDWFDRAVTYSKTLGGGTSPEALMFMHIPLIEMYDFNKNAINSKDGYSFVYGVDEDEIKPHEYEWVCASNLNTGLYSKMKEAGNFRGVFIGHEHLRPGAVKNDDDDIVLCFGTKATNIVSYEEENGVQYLGGEVIMYDKTGDDEFKLHHIFHNYSDLK